MNDEDLFAVFTEKSGATTASRPKEGDADKKAPLEIIEYDGFCVDGAPAQHFDWRAVPSSANVRGWKPVTFQPLISVPLPLARRTCRSKDDVHDVHAATRGAAAVQMKKPAGNACFNCGESGHNVQCCPKPRDNDAINKRRKAWESERAPRPSWMDEPRYFVAPSESKVGHVKPGILSSELCAALGISSSHLVPPPYLANMIREGYPPGFVGVEGMSENGDAEEEEETLRFICGGEEMDLSDEDKEDGEAGPSRSHQAAKARKISDHAGKKAVMTVVFPGAFGAPPPPGVDQRLWDFTPRVQTTHMVHHPFQAHLFQGLVQQQYTPVPHTHNHAASSSNGSHIYQNVPVHVQHNLVYAAAPVNRPAPLASAPTQPSFQFQQHERGARGYYGVGGVSGGYAEGYASGYVGGYGGTYGNDYSAHHAPDYRAAHYGYPPASGGGGAWASQRQHPASQFSQNQQYQYDQTAQLWGGSSTPSNGWNPGGFSRYPT